MPASSSKQNEFHSTLDSFINHCGNSRIGRLTSLIWPKLVLNRQARSISTAYSDLQAVLPEPISEAIEIPVPAYDGDCFEVRQMISGLRSIQDDLAGAYVHGSLATNERVNYSDFDALVILKSSVLETPARLAEVASKLVELRHMMISLDPLQHHGWFVLTEADLIHYCEAYFPIELFRYSRSLLKDSGQSLSLYPRDSSEETQSAFQSLSTSVIRKTRDAPAPGTLYELKSLLSQFMLLPALYIQARYGNAVFKKNSFEIAKQDFSDESWEIMDEVSGLRDSWPSLNTSLRSRLLSRSPVFWHRYIAKPAFPSIPSEILTILNREFYVRMSELAQAMRDQIDQRD